MKYKLASCSEHCWYLFLSATTYVVTTCHKIANKCFKMCLKSAKPLLNAL